MKTIALIDGEVNAKSLQFPARLRQQFKITSSYSPEAQAINAQHANLIAQILELQATDYQLINYIVLNGNSSASIDDLIDALTHCLHSDIDIISLSIGTLVPSDALQLYPLFQQLNEKGVITVAAQSNSGEWTFPASFDNVIGVQCDAMQQLRVGELSVHPNHPLGIEITANCSYTLHSSHHSLLNRNSFAVPVVVAQICTLLQDGPRSKLKLVQQLFERYHNTIADANTSARNPFPTCRVCISENNVDFSYCNDLLRQLNFSCASKTLGVYDNPHLSYPCWFKVPQFETLPTAVQLLETHSIAEIILIACNDSTLQEVPQDFPIDLTLQILRDNRILWIPDRDVSAALSTPLLSAHDLAFAIQRVLSAGDLRFLTPEVIL